jgi:hypothetical protein
VRDFVLQLDKTLSARRLYAPGSAPHAEATETLYRKLRRAAEGGEFTLHLGPTDLSYDRQSLLSKARREEAFFFPLFRDGLRELTFSSNVSPADLSMLLAVFELKDRDLGEADDTVNALWRCDFSTIRYKAIDELQDAETDGGDDLRDLVRQTGAQIAMTSMDVDHPRVPDEDSNARDIGYDYAMIRRAFEDGLDELRRTAEQTGEMRTELGDGRVQTLVERFIEILLVTVWVPFKSIDPALIAPILAQLIDGYWSTHEHERASVLLTHVNAASRQAPSPVSRRTMRDVIDRFLTDEKILTIVAEFERGVISPRIASAVFDVLPDAKLWQPLLDVLPHLSDPEKRLVAMSTLKKRLEANRELLSSTFASFDAARIRAALLLIDETQYAPEIIGLASHPDEAIRLRGLKAAAATGGPIALEVLWKAMESDPSKAVRLYAFRSIAGSKVPGLASRLEALVTSPDFENRPVWEREKYIRLLGTVAGTSCEVLFESWIPKRRMWNKKDLETLELALRGLGACGESGYEKVRAMSTQSGKPAEVARKVLDTISRSEISGLTVSGQEVPLPKIEEKNH